MKVGPWRFFEKRIIGGEADPLLIRWKIFRSKRFGVFVHKLCRSDHDRALHDHPWSFLSLVLFRGYVEVTETGPIWRWWLSLAFRPATWKHRVVIDGKPAWTLIFVGRRKREWGFWPETGWCWWRKYNTDLGICEEEPLWEEMEA